MDDHTIATTHANAAPRGTHAIYTLDDLERIEKSISTAPVPARPLTAADALASLASTLSKARDKGHSLTGLVQLCVQQGLHVSERAVSRAINTSKTAVSAKKKPSRAHKGD